jgi:hypothetical protein
MVGPPDACKKVYPFAQGGCESGRDWETIGNAGIRKEAEGKKKCANGYTLLHRLCQYNIGRLESSILKLYIVE